MGELVLVVRDRVPKALPNRLHGIGQGGELPNLGVPNIWPVKIRTQRSGQVQLLGQLSEMLTVCRRL